jgi:hypothetical protein
MDGHMKEDVAGGRKGARSTKSMVDGRRRTGVNPYRGPIPRPE